MSSPDDHPHEKSGMLFAIGAYAFWGVMPLYWKLFDHVGPFELTSHRVLWCAIFCVMVTLARGRFSQLIQIAKTPRVLVPLIATSLLITANWTIFIYTVATHQ